MDSWYNLPDNNINVIYPTGGGATRPYPTVPAVPSVTPTPAPDPQTQSAITGIKPEDVAKATYGKIIPLVVGGMPRIGGYIIYGPKFTTVSSVPYVTFGVSMGLQANPDGEREIREIRFDGIQVWTISGGSTLPGLVFRTTQGTETQEPDALLVADYGDAAPAYRGQVCIFIEGLNLTPFNGSVPFVSAVIADVTDGADPTDGLNLGTALETIANSPYVNIGADFEAVDVTARVLAIIDAENTSFLELLRRFARLLPLDVVQTDKLRLIERPDVAPDIVLTEGRILAGEDLVKIDRQPEQGVAQELEFIYIDIDRDYEFTPQRARRPLAPIAVTSSRAKETINLPVVTTASEAIAWVTLRKYWDEVARQQVSFTALPYGMAIEPGSMVALKLPLRTYVVRISETLHDARGTVQCVGTPILRCSYLGFDDGPEIEDGDEDVMSLFVTVGFNGGAMETWTSSDGVDWAEQTFPDGSLESPVIADRAGALFVVGVNNVIGTSVNGDSWVLATTPSLAGSLIFGVDCGNPSTCVAIGQDGSSDPLILTSPDGVTWEQQSSPVSAAFLDGAAYGAGIHVAVGSYDAGDALILSSADGSAWTEQTADPTDCSLYAIAFDGSIFIAVGNPSVSGPPAVMTSSNGTAWSDASAGTALLDDGYFNGVACSPTRTVAVGAWGGAAGIATFNGSTWTDRTPGGSPNGILFSVSYIGTDWVAVGDTGGGTPQNLIYLSNDDGLTWAQQTTPVSVGRLFGVVGRA